MKIGISKDSHKEVPDILQGSELSEEFDAWLGIINSLYKGLEEMERALMRAYICSAILMIIIILGGIFICKMK